ncbi:MAG: hypothetical protein AAFO74_15165 [Pseudomonadota bacterium]
MESKNASSSPARLSPFTLLATITLAVTNLMVGIMQNNTFLVLASAGISAALAIVYSAKIGLLPMLNWPARAAEGDPLPKTGPKSKFPLWLFIALLFGILPFALLFLQFAQA